MNQISKGQTTVEYILSVVIVIALSAAFSIFTNDTTHVHGRHLFGLMYENMETTVSRAYP